MNNKNISVDTAEIEEIQLTHLPQGHFLNQRQAFSPDNEYLVFDNRNDDSKIGENGRIQLVYIASKQVETVYEIPNQSFFGPGLGAVSFHPSEKKIVFIHGLNNASESIPYGVTRRIAMQVNLEKNNHFTRLEARDVAAPYTKGALRGGSHAYSYNAGGTLVSFTYNDAVLADESLKNPNVQDLRTVGAFVLGHQVIIKGEKNDENFDGNAFAVLLAEVVSKPEPGSDEITKAYEECWVGDSGYTKSDGNQQQLALAFLGDVLSESGEKLSEVFIADIPDSIAGLMDSVDAGSNTELPSIPKGVKQRRLTFTQNSVHPGVQGPRQWLRTSPDGDAIYFYRKDDSGVVQIYSVSPNGGECSPITANGFSSDTSFSLSSDGKYLAYGAKEALYITRVSDGKTSKILDAPDTVYSSLSNINWSTSGHTLAYNRKVDHDGQAFFQIFILNLSPFLNHNL